jgi:hypothetical protein
MRVFLVAALLLAAGVAHAETREVTGGTLIFTDSISSDVTISTDPSLAGRVRVSGGDSLSCLSVTEGSAAIIETRGCADSSLHIDVPPGMPLTITQSADGTLTIDNTDAPVILTLNGSGDVHAGRTGPLVVVQHGSADLSLGDVRGAATLEMTGSGDVRMKSLEGPLTIKHRGSGDIAVGSIETPALTIDSSGSGDKLIGSGHVGFLQVRMTGDGDLAVAAEVKNANVTASGGGDVKLGKVTGNLSRDASGGSDIIVGGPALIDDTIGKVASAIGSGSGGHGMRVHVGDGGGGHLVTLAVLAVLGFIAWRIVKRGRLQRPAAPAAAAQGAPMHPGVAAVCDTLKRVEDRLGRVEGYVTSREFDLQQKFKKL